MHEVYAVKFGQHTGGKRADYFYGTAAEPLAKPTQLDYFVWLIRSPGQDVVVDAGFTAETAARHEFRGLVERDDIERLVGYGLDGRLLFVDGEHEVVPGVRVHHVGGHTAGLQIVSVQTARGTVVLAADASHLYGNIENDAPFGVITELPAMYDTFDRINGLAGSPELVVPGHDPDVLARFEPGDGLDGRAVRVA